MFLDSDDVLTANAYELLVGALDRTGSDFATGNVYRLTTWATVQSPFLARAFAETRLKTHVTKYRPLLADRPAWNKVWRRSFWDEHGFRFPEGRTYEDTPVTIPAHFLAKSVDVISEPCYLWRIREGGAQSITQRKHDPQSLIDRLTSIQEVSDHLARRRPARLQALVRRERRRRRPALLRQLARRRRRRVPRAVPRPRQRVPGRRERPDLQAAAGDRAAQVALRAAPDDARAARGRALPEGGDRPHAAAADPRPLVRRLPVPHRPAAERPAVGLPARRWSSRWAPGSRSCASRTGRSSIRGHAYVNGIDAGSEDAQKISVSLLRPGRLPACACSPRRCGCRRARRTGRRSPATSAPRSATCRGRASRRRSTRASCAARVAGRST